MVGDPLVQSRRGPSDHVPLRVSVNVGPQRPAGRRLLPPWVCSASKFVLLLEKFQRYMTIELKTGICRWISHKAAIREAGRCCRNAPLTGSGTTRPPRSAVLSMIARAVWCQDRDSTTDILASHPAAAEFLSFGDDRVDLLRPELFAENVAIVKTAELII